MSGLTVFIGNVNMDKATGLEVLSLMSKFGKITHFQDHTSLGFCYVTMSTVSEVQQLITQHKKLELHGRHLVLRKSIRQIPTNTAMNDTLTNRMPDDSYNHMQLSTAPTNNNVQQQLTSMTPRVSEKSIKKNRLIPLESAQFSPCHEILYDNFNIRDTSTSSYTATSLHALNKEWNSGDNNVVYDVSYCIDRRPDIDCAGTRTSINDCSVLNLASNLSEHIQPRQLSQQQQQYSQRLHSTDDSYQPIATNNGNTAVNNNIISGGGGGGSNFNNILAQYSHTLTQQRSIVPSDMLVNNSVIGNSGNTKHNMQDRNYDNTWSTLVPSTATIALSPQQQRGVNIGQNNRDMFVTTDNTTPLRGVNANNLNINTQVSLPRKGICFEFSRYGRCKYGHTCKFPHEFSSNRPTAATAVTNQVMSTKSVNRPSVVQSSYREIAEKGADVREEGGLGVTNMIVKSANQVHALKPPLPPNPPPREQSQPQTPVLASVSTAKVVVNKSSPALVTAPVATTAACTTSQQCNAPPVIRKGVERCVLVDPSRYHKIVSDKLTCCDTNTVREVVKEKHVVSGTTETMHSSTVNMNVTNESKYDDEKAVHRMTAAASKNCIVPAVYIPHKKLTSIPPVLLHTPISLPPPSVHVSSVSTTKSSSTVTKRKQVIATAPLECFGFKKNTTCNDSVSHHPSVVEAAAAERATKQRVSERKSTFADDKAQCDVVAAAPTTAVITINESKKVIHKSISTDTVNDLINTPCNDTQSTKHIQLLHDKLCKHSNQHNVKSELTTELMSSSSPNLPYLEELSIVSSSESNSVSDSDHIDTAADILQQQHHSSSESSTPSHLPLPTPDSSDIDEECTAEDVVMGVTVADNESDVLEIVKTNEVVVGEKEVCHELQYLSPHMHTELVDVVDDGLTLRSDSNVVSNSVNTISSTLHDNTEINNKKRKFPPDDNVSAISANNTIRDGDDRLPTKSTKLSAISTVRDTMYSAGKLIGGGVVSILSAMRTKSFQLASSHPLALVKTEKGVSESED